MSIAAANLFTRPTLIREQARLASFIVKFGAFIFIGCLSTQYVLNFQLLGGIWFLQTMPAVFLGFYIRGFNRWVLLVGMMADNWMFIAASQASVCAVSRHPALQDSSCYVGDPLWLRKTHGVYAGPCTLFPLPAGWFCRDIGMFVTGIGPFCACEPAQ
jgi:hypothetical protein